MWTQTKLPASGRQAGIGFGGIPIPGSGASPVGGVTGHADEFAGAGPVLPPALMMTRRRAPASASPRWGGSGGGALGVKGVLGPVAVEHKLPGGHQLRRADPTAWAAMAGETADLAPDEEKGPRLGQTFTRWRSLPATFVSRG